MKTLVCGIGKNENRYVREWVEHYKGLGVTNICLYDNNDEDGEKFEDVIADYIDSGFVIMKDYKDRVACQLEAYNECYQEYSKEYDWIMFFDLDEFLTIVDGDVNTWLSSEKYNGFDMIHVNWMTYGDGGNVDVDDRPLKERFPLPMDYEKALGYTFPENCTAKTVLRGGLNDIDWEKLQSPHTVEHNGRCCTANGVEKDCKSPFHVFVFETAYLKHYSTKTAREYAWKMKRGFPDHVWDMKSVREDLIKTRFFRVNEITQEKINIFAEELGLDLSYLLLPKSDDVKIFMLCYDKKDYALLDDNVVTPLQLGAAIPGRPNVCDLKDNVGDNISSTNFFYVENTGTYWIWKNVHGAKYKGQMQYRRWLKGIDGKTDFDKIFENHDVITCKPYHHPSHKEATPEEPMVIPADTVQEGYAFSNCGYDLYLLERSVKHNFPEYAEDWDKYILHGPNLYYSNGFVLREEDYDRYCHFLFTCINGYLGQTRIKDQATLLTHVAINLGMGRYRRYENPDTVPQEAIQWQTYIGGFLSERLWTLWLLHNFKKDRIYEVEYIKKEKNMYT